MDQDNDQDVGDNVDNDDVDDGGDGLRDSDDDDAMTEVLPASSKQRRKLSSAAAAVNGEADSELVAVSTDEKASSSSSNSSSITNSNFIDYTEYDFDRLIAKVTGESSTPHEAMTMKQAHGSSSSSSSGSGTVKLTVEERYELAAVAVKRAFSECPNYSLLVSALLRYPLHELHKHCRLLSGVPVAPMVT